MAGLTDMRPIFRRRHEWQATYYLRLFGNWIAPYAMGGAFALMIAAYFYLSLLPFS